jgi:hypothetical protein
MAGWTERAARATARYEDGAARLPRERDERQRQLTRMGNAAAAAGVSLLMAGRREASAEWLRRAAARYRESWPLAPAESWGRPIGAMKARLLAGDRAGAVEDASWTLEAGAATSASPIGLYAAALAYLVRAEDEEARTLAATLRDRGDFPRAVADGLHAIAAGDLGSYEPAVRAVLADSESRDTFLEDVPVADTVLVLQELAARRGLAVSLSSPLLPSTPPRRARVRGSSRPGWR